MLIVVVNQDIRILGGEVGDRVGVGEAPQPQDHRQPNEVVTFVLPLSVGFNCDDFNSGPLGGNPLI